MQRAGREDGPNMCGHTCPPAESPAGAVAAQVPPAPVDVALQPIAQAAGLRQPAETPGLDDRLGLDADLPQGREIVQHQALPSAP
jgi:hypothetical protein